MKNFIGERPLLPNDIEVRIDTISDKTFTVVCYVNPRTAMFYLDEAFGADNWSKRITVDKKSQDSPVFAICTIEAKLEDGSTVTREDVGESKDSPKSAVSDSIKRTAMNFFPALRALYTIPPLRIYPSDLGLGKIEGKEKIKDVIRYKKFFVESITFGEGETGTFVKALQIGEEDAEAVVCKYESKRKSLSKGDTESVLQLKQMLIEASVDEEILIKRYQDAFRVSSLEEIANTDNLFESAKNFLERTKEKKAQNKPASKAKSVNDQLKGKAKEE